MALSPTLPSASSQLHIAEARAALVASVSNMLDSELQSRAGLLHANAAALGRQERDVERATEALRRENDKLAGVARDAGRKIKELGNVQNWAEVLERDFLVLEETVRIVRDGDGEADDDDDCSVCSGSCFCSWSGSEGARSRSRSRSRGGSRSRSRSRGGSVVRARQVEANGNDKKEELNGAVRNDATKDGTANGGVGTAPAVSVSNVKVLADDALIQSLTEAMATEMHVVVGPPRADEPPPPPPSAAPDKDKDKDKGKGPLCQNDQLEKRDLDGSHDDAPPESTAPSTSSSAAGEEGDRQRQ
ncbi:hypothetical protein F4809DRAFT_612854 [Biscogniauxia mediterranea]|nr:hypothetical protein F4809DRAFT_612854 [Biscogniauxia mediterranea]